MTTFKPFSIEQRNPVMIDLVRRFRRDESGATAIEYGMIAALIAVVVIGALRLVGSRLNVKFSAIATQLN